MHRTLKFLTFFGASGLLAGCATTPSLHYKGPAPEHSPVADQNVSLQTKVTAGTIIHNDCFFALTKMCRRSTMKPKHMIADYDKILSSALEQEGAKRVADSGSAAWTIETHITNGPASKYPVLVHYEIGKTMEMGLIPIVGMFTPRYYGVHVNIEDHVTIFHEGKAVWHADIPESYTHHFGSNPGNHAIKAYRTAQDAAVSEILTGLSETH